MPDSQLPPDDADFRRAVREWLAENLVGEFATLRGLGGPGSEHVAFEEWLAWNRQLAAAGWTCLVWPVEQGGRGASIAHQVIFQEEYARANAPQRVNKTSDVVSEGQAVKVKLLGFDDRGKVRLSMKAVDQVTGEDLTKKKPEGEAPAAG